MHAHRGCVSSDIHVYDYIHVLWPVSVDVVFHCKAPRAMRIGAI